MIEKGDKKMEVKKASKMKIVRCNGSGVWAGEVASQDGDTAVLKNAIRIWKWEGAASLSELAVSGTKMAVNCKFCIPVDEVEVFNVLEIIKCTAAAEVSIRGVKTWTA